MKKYDLPSIYEVMEEPTSKNQWKAKLRKVVNTQWEKRIIEESNSRTSLKYLCADNYQQGKLHNIWILSNIDTLEVKKAGIKANLIAGTYKVQTMTSKFQKKKKNCASYM